MNKIFVMGIMLFCSVEIRNMDFVPKMKFEYLPPHDYLTDVDVCTYTERRTPGQRHISGPKGFYLTFRPVRTFEDNPQGKIYGAHHLFSNVPFIHHYPAGRETLQCLYRRCCFIEFDIDNFFNQLPVLVQRMLVESKNKNIRGNIIIWLLTKENVPSQLPYVNINFHTWVGSWLYPEVGYREFLPEFRQNISMGIFEAQGASEFQDKKVAISFNRLGIQEVYYHKIHRGFGYSPNNARFIIDISQDIITFWSVAQSPNKQHALVTFHILSNNDDINTQVIKITKKAPHLYALLQEFDENLIPALKTMHVKERFKNALKTIKSMTGSTYQFQDKYISQDVLITALEQMHKSLQLLRNLL